MYRKESYRRVYQRIHYLKHKQKKTHDLIKKVELDYRIRNLKNIITLSMW